MARCVPKLAESGAKVSETGRIQAGLLPLSRGQRRFDSLRKLLGRARDRS